MLRVAEHAHRTDTGRQRNANEDAYFARGPLFAVADGMGGAQAGEVASQLATESFEPVQRGEESPEAYLRAIARTANARIHRLAQADSSRSGMGTTLTAALVEDDEVSFAHVGDSRAYLFRDGELKLLTSDHSLVEELRRQGRLTDEQAEDHPQRSIITRALGPEREVEVDTMTYRARPGDVYLLCSDGLTTMVREDRIAATLADTESLDDAVSSLVREANEAGGRDNVTVVAFRLEEAEAAAETKEEPTLIGPAAEEAGLTAGAMAEAARQARRLRSGRRPPPGLTGGPGASPSPLPRWRSSRRSSSAPSTGCARSTSSEPIPAGVPRSTAAFRMTSRWGSSSTRRSMPRRSRSPRSRPAGERAPRITPCALTTTQPTCSPTSSRRRSRRFASARAGETGSGRRQGGARNRALRRIAARAAERAVSARNRELFALLPVARAGHRWIHRGVHRRVEPDRGPEPDLRRLLPGRLPGRPPVHPSPAAPCRPVPVSALRVAGRDRPGDAVPDQRRPGPEAGVDLRWRRGLCWR